MSHEKMPFDMFAQTPALHVTSISFSRAIVIPTIGFIPSSFLFLIAYGTLLGERRIGYLAVVSLIITAILYVLFQGGLDIMLPRGTGVFRSFALFFETKLPF